MGWDGMKWAGLGEMVFAITYFTTATNLTLLFCFCFCVLYTYGKLWRGVSVLFLLLVCCVGFFGCERDTWVFFGLIGLVWDGLGCMVFSCYSYTSLMN
jgi:hypothetical protein